MRNGGRSGLQAEAMAFAKAQALPVHKALVHMFFAQRTTKNVRLYTEACCSDSDACSTQQLSHAAVSVSRIRCAIDSGVKGFEVQVKGVTDRGLKPKKMTVVGVLGGGLMGSGIATALAWTGYTVLLKEIKQEFLDSGMKRIKANMDSRVKKKAMTPQARDAAMARVKGTLTYDGFKVRFSSAAYVLYTPSCLCGRFFKRRA